MSTRFACRIVTVLFAAAALAGAGCDKKKMGGGDGSASSPFKLMLDWRPEPEFGGFYSAQLRGDWAKNGLNVSISSAGEGAPMWQLVANGQAAFVTTSADQVMIARAQGADVVGIYAVYQTCPLGIMVHAERGFSQLSDVFTHEGILAMEDRPWLSFCTQKFSPVKVTMTSFSGGISAFLAKPNYSEQCYISSEPVEAKRQGAKVQAFLLADSGYNPYTTVVVTSGERIKNQPGQVRAMIEACRAGWRAYLDDPSATNVELHKLTPQMDEQDCKEASVVQKPLIETDPSHPAALGAMTLERWTQLGQQLQQLKVLTTVPPAGECFVNEEQLK